REELRLHAGKVRKYLVLHDTTTFAERGETEGHKGLWPAVEEFLARGTFRLNKRYDNNHGLAGLSAGWPWTPNPLPRRCRGPSTTGAVPPSAHGRGSSGRCWGACGA